MIQKLKTINTIHLAICMGVILAYVALGDLTTLEGWKIPIIDATASLYLIIPVVAIVLGNFLFKSQLKNVNPDLEIEDKMSAYQTAALIRWAIIEAGAFAILVLNPDFVLVGVLLIVYLIFLKPTESRIKRELGTKGKSYVK